MLMPRSLKASVGPCHSSPICSGGRGGCVFIGSGGGVACGCRVRSSVVSSTTAGVPNASKALAQMASMSPGRSSASASPTKRCSSAAQS